MWLTILYSFVSGVVGTALGALIPVLFDFKSDKALSLIMSFTAGFMVAVVCFDMLPESIHMSKLWVTLICLAAGMVVVMLANLAVKKPMEKYDASGGDTRHFAGVGILLIIAMSMHNLPEGMAIGSLQVVEKGLPISLLIALHNIPEGIAIAAPLRKAGMGRLKSLGLASLSGVPMVLGAILGYGIANISDTFIGVCLAIAAGAMAYIIFEDLLKEAFEHCRSKEVGVLGVIGLIAGIGLITAVGMI